MLHTGLLWFDDDAKRPLLDKVVAAVARYGERLGAEPTVCQLNPATAAQLAAQQEKERQLRRTRTPDAARHRSARGAAPSRARLPLFIPDPSLPINYFLVGVEASDTPSDAAPREQSTLLPPAMIAGTPSSGASVSAARERRPARSRQAVQAPAPHAAEITAPSQALVAAAEHAEPANSGPTPARPRRARPATASHAATPPQAPAAPPLSAPSTSTRKRPATVVVHETPTRVAPSPRPKRRRAHDTADVVQPHLPLLDDQPIAAPSRAHPRRVSRHATKTPAPVPASPTASKARKESKTSKTSKTSRATKATKTTKATKATKAPKSIKPAEIKEPSMRGERTRPTIVAPASPEAGRPRRRPAALADTHVTPVQPHSSPVSPRRRAS